MRTSTRWLRLGLVALCSVAMLIAATPPVVAQEAPQPEPPGDLQESSGSGGGPVVDGTVISTESVEIDGVPYVVNRVRVTSALGGEADEEILVSVPGGPASNGLTLYVSHVPTFQTGDRVQVALSRAGDLETAMDSPLEVYSLRETLAPSRFDGNALFGGSWHSRRQVTSFAQPMDYRINVDGSPLEDQATVAAIIEGFDRWENLPGTAIDFRYRGRTSFVGSPANATVPIFNGQNTVSFRNDGQGSLAYVWLDNANSVVEFDMVLDSTNNLSDVVTPSAFHLQTVVGHEVGHILGFDHVQDARSLMFPSGQPGVDKPLGPGDIAGARTLYPEQDRRASVADPQFQGGEEDFGSVLAVGDFDGDGVEDYAVGLPGKDQRAGGVRVVGSQRTFFLDQATGQVPGAPESGDEFGAALATGDFNGDGLDDLAIGSPGESIKQRTAAGLVTVVYGDGVRLAATGVGSFHQNSAGIAGSAEAGDRFGSSLAVGDFNGDGLDDLAIGTPGESIGPRDDAGAVTIMYGQPSGLIGSESAHVSQSSGTVQGAPERGDEFGASLAAGDFNGDGFDELVVGSPGEGLGPRDNAGMFHVLHGSSAGTSKFDVQVYVQNSGFARSANEAGDRYASALAVGDFDGNGLDDLAVGAPNEALGQRTNAGMITVLYSFAFSDSLEAPRHFQQSRAGIPGAAERGDLFGTALAAGDVDGDGRDDLVVGSPGENNGSGAVHVLFSQPSGLNGTAIERSDDTTLAGTKLGAAVAVGDINGDGDADYLVGSPGFGAIGKVSLFLD